MDVERSFVHLKNRIKNSGQGLENYGNGIMIVDNVDETIPYSVNMFNLKKAYSRDLVYCAMLTHETHLKNRPRELATKTKVSRASFSLFNVFRSIKHNGIIDNRKLEAIGTFLYDQMHYHC